MPPGNPLGCVPLNLPLDPQKSSKQLNDFTEVIPVLMDCSFPSSSFRQTAYRDLWKRFQVSYQVQQFIRLPLVGVWYLGVVEIRRKNGVFKHPFVFCHGNAHEAFRSLHPATNFYAMALIRCSGFSGGPTGECSRTLCAQISRLPAPLRPQYIISDRSASRSVSTIEGYNIVPERRLFTGWGWPPVSVFRCR